MLLFLGRAHSADAQATLPVYRGAAAPIDVRVRDLVGRMTVEEKFWQLFMIPGDLDDSTHAYFGTEFDLFVSVDDGAQWIDLRLNMPTLAINDLADSTAISMISLAGRRPIR